MIGHIQSRTQCMAIPQCASGTQILSRSSFKGAQLQRTARNARVCHERFEVQNFKFMKNLGLKKPAFLPDFGLDKRKALLDNFFTSFDQSSLQSIIADDVQVIESGRKQPYGKADFIAFVSGVLKPSIPNFSWSHITTGEKDDEGYSIVKIQGAGSHTGKAYSVPNSNLPPVEASSKRLSLPEQTVKVKVEDGVIKELRYLAQGSDLQTDIYRELGGKVPASV